MTKKLAISVMAVLVVSLGLALQRTQAQQRGARGQAAGQPAAQRGGARGAQSEPPLWLPDEDFVRWPLPEGDQQYAKIDGFKIKNYINVITAFSRKSRRSPDSLCPECPSDHPAWMDRVRSTTRFSPSIRPARRQFSRPTSP